MTGDESVNRPRVQNGETPRRRAKMVSVRLPALAFSSIAVAVLLMAAVLFPVDVARWTVPAVVSAALMAFALGWPRLLGAPARRSLSATILVPGLIAVWVMAVLEAGVEFSSETVVGDRPDLWLAPVAALIALGTMAGFVVQVIRGQGRPFRLESTATTVAGVAIATSSSAWVVLARTHLESIALWFQTSTQVSQLRHQGDDSSMAVVITALLAGAAGACLIGLVPTSLLVRLVTMVLVSGAAPIGIYFWLNHGQIPLAGSLGIAGALTGLLIGLIRAAAEQEQRGQLISQTHGLAWDVDDVDDTVSSRRGELTSVLSLGAAPILVTGMVLYFTLWVVPPIG